jgi:hypothetical protein
MFCFNALATLLSMPISADTHARFAAIANDRVGVPRSHFHYSRKEYRHELRKRADHTLIDSYELITYGP